VVLQGNTDGVWNTGETTTSITVNSTGSYFVTNTNECGNAISNAIPVSVFDVPQCQIDGDLNPKKGDTTFLCAPEGIHSYKWSTLEKTRCITLTESGERSVTVTNNNICVDSCTVNVVFSDISSSEDQNAKTNPLKLNIYPNPFYNDASIEFKHSLSGQEIKIDIYNVIGEKVTQMHFGHTISEQWHKLTLQGSDLAAGIYMVRLTSGKTILHKRIILIK
jgi:hypothetical protein